MNVEDEAAKVHSLVTGASGILVEMIVKRRLSRSRLRDVQDRLRRADAAIERLVTGKGEQ